MYYGKKYLVKTQQYTANNYNLKVSRSRNKIVELQILPKIERTNEFVCLFFGRICSSTILFRDVLIFRDPSKANWATGAAWPPTTDCCRIYNVYHRIYGETTMINATQCIAVIHLQCLKIIMLFQKLFHPMVLCFDGCENEWL